MSTSAPDPHVVTLTPNAALDVTLAVDGLRAGAKQSLRSERVQAGGKGVNVSRGLARLGVPSLALVVLGGDTGEQIRQSLARDDLPALTLEAEGESRTCLELVEPGGRATQIHGAGVDASGDVAARVLAVIDELPTSLRWLALCGSLPSGMPAQAARELLGAARRRGLRTAVDIRGPALREAAAATPDLLRINAEEFRELTPLPLERWLRDQSDRPEVVIVSRGAAAFDVMTAREELWRVHPPELQAVNTIGCGDAMMAGWLAAQLEGVSLEQAIRRATALAAAEALSPVAGQPDPGLARTLAARVMLERR